MMKINKLTITIIIILTLTIFGQLIYFKIKEKNESQKIDNQIEIDKIDLDIYRIREFLEVYNGELSDEEIKGMLTSFVVNTIPEIQEYTNYKTSAEIEDYYNSNIEAINDMGIDNVEDYLLISEQINNIIRDNTTSLIDVRVNAIANPNQKIGYYSFELILNCSNSKKMSFICDVSLNKTQEKAMIYHSNNELATIYTKPNIMANKRETLDMINNFVNNIKNVCVNNQLRGENYQAQYYDKNTANLNKMGIYSAEDMKSILLKYSNNISWNNNEQLNYYTIDLNSLKEEENYTTFKVSLVYDYIEQVELTIEFSKKENVIPSVRISTTNI